MLDLEAFSRAEQADQPLFHLLLGQPFDSVRVGVCMRYRIIFRLGSSCDLTETGSLRKR